MTVAPIVIRALLWPLAAIAGYFVAWGLVFVMDAVVRAFFGTISGGVSWIPFAGRVLSKPVNYIEHKLTSFLGGLEAHFENQMASRWHALAALITQLAADTEDNAIALWKIARRINQLYSDAATGKLGSRFQRWVRGEIAKLHSVSTTVVRPVKVVTNTVTHYVAPKVGALAGELDRVITWDIPRLRARTKALEGRFSGVLRRLRALEKRSVALIGLGALAVALTRAGLGWLKCAKVSRLGRRACSMDTSLFDALLADTLLVLGTVSLVEFAEEMIGVTETAVRPIVTFWRAE